VLCGRATWKDGIAIFAKNGEDAFRRWLETTGVENINNVNLALEAASPWYLKFGVKSMAELG
jgi:tagatose 1,6-diphosphate aldolase